jgi:hypothetical protein
MPHEMALQEFEPRMRKTDLFICYLLHNTRLYSFIISYFESVS